jgi:serine protease Do
VKLRSLYHFCLLLFVCCQVRALSGQESGEIPQAAIDAAVQNVADSVVQIETIGGVEQGGDKLSSAGPTSGTVLSADGWIITSSYSFQRLPAAIIVRTPDGERHSAKLVARDRGRELVLLKAEPNALFRPLVAAPLKEVQVGQSAIALGKVFDPRQPSVSVGIVSAVGRVWGKAIQTDARISPTNYGGPLIDLQGRCLGILAPLNPGDGSTEDGSQWYDSGIGFAAAIDQILRSAESLKEGKDVFPGRLGVSLSEQDDYSGPVLVAGAAANSPAAEIGLQRGDRIMQINGTTIDMLAHLKLQLGPVNAGDLVQLKIQRAEKELDMQCILVAEIPPYHPPYLGILPGLAADNVVIAKEVLPNSPAVKAGLQAGDKLLQANGTSIASVNELREILQNHMLEKPLALRWQRGTEAAVDSNTILLEHWPTDPVVKLAEVEKVASTEDKPPAGTGVIELPLGDVPNKCFAFVPPSYKADVPHGVMIVLPEAGEVDQRALLDQWEPLCRAHRWIFAALSSADAKGWTLEEIELVGRTLTLLKTNYNVDNQRVATVGIRSAAPLAAVAAFGQRTKFNALLILGGEFPARLNAPAAQPFEFIRTLIVNESDNVTEVAEQLTEKGHPTGTIMGSVDVGGKVAPAQSEIIQLWLRGLERL